MVPFFPIDVLQRFTCRWPACGLCRAAGFLAKKRGQRKKARSVDLDCLLERAGQAVVDQDFIGIRDDREPVFGLCEGLGRHPIRKRDLIGQGWGGSIQSGDKQAHNH